MKKLAVTQNPWNQCQASRPLLALPAIQHIYPDGRVSVERSAEFSRHNECSRLPSPWTALQAYIPLAICAIAVTASLHVLAR